MMHPLWLFLAFSGCFARHGQVADALEGRYLLGSPGGPGWTAGDPGGADYVWWNAALKASLYADSNCGPRFEDAPLPMLVNRLLAGITDSQDLEGRSLQVGGRGALYRARRGTMDGVPIQVGAVVMKKDSCTYDFVLIAPPDAYETALPALWDVVEGFSQRIQ
ncbi:MAG: hypothetical protein JXB39_02125 [Deltaproteobacteria bacterium]|nr:hypothetical protein [Deltaproteobacteria bacterium]